MTDNVESQATQDTQKERETSAPAPEKEDTGTHEEITTREREGSLLEDEDQRERQERRQRQEARGRTEEESESEDREPAREQRRPVNGEDEDWRNSFIKQALKGQEHKLTASKLAKRAEGLKNQLSRYRTEQDFMLAGLAAQEKLRSGEYKRAVLPEDATDEEMSAWRKENGIPQTGEEYDFPKIPGHTWSEEDGPLIESFKETAWRNNFRQEQVDAAAKWYATTLAEQQNKWAETIAQIDRDDREDSRDTLRNELGNADFKPTLKLINRLVTDPEEMPDDIGRLFVSARYTDDQGYSRRLINNVGVARFFARLAQDTYGVASGGAGESHEVRASRKAEIEKIMETDINRYRRENLAEEYHEILSEEQRIAEGGRRRRR